MKHPVEVVQDQMNNPDLWVEPQNSLEQALQYQLKIIHRSVVTTLAGSDKAEEMFASFTKWDKDPRKRIG